MSNSKSIGEKIAYARKKKNLSQAQLSKLLFISSQAVGKWERGESMPDITTFDRLAAILDVDLNYFSKGKSDAEEVDPKKSIDTEKLIVLTSNRPHQRPKRNMSSSNWIDVDFSGLKDINDKFTSSNMQRCKFIGSDLSGLLLKNNNFDSCDFSSSNIKSSNIKNSHFDNNQFRECSLLEAEFFKSHVQGCDFSGSDFNNCQTERSHFANNQFKDTSFKNSNFANTYFQECNFSGADFTGASFRAGGFSDNNIEGAVWNETSFIGTHIDNIIFNGKLTDCYFEKCTFNWVKFEGSTLVNAFFKNNRLNTYKKIRFVDCQVDQLTYEFLKIGNADLTGVTLLGK